MVNETNTPGDAVIRAQFFDAMIKQVAVRQYKFMQALNVSSTGAWTNFFFREKIGELAGQGTRTIRGIPRNANFPQASVEWDRIETTIEKYGLEEVIPWEDIISDEINVMERTSFKIGRGVAKAVDDKIWTELGGDQLASASAITSSKGIQAFSVGRNTGTPANFKPWNTASAAILDDLFRARQLIEEQNYNVNNLICFMSPLDFRSLMTFLTDKGAQYPQLSQDIANFGQKKQIAGIQIETSNSVTASNALICVPKQVATWKELVPLQSTTIEDKYKNVTIRAVQLGVLQLTDPQAAVLITGTQGG